LLFKGLVIGVSVAAPVGPIGVLTIQRTLARGRLVGFVTGLGVASADALYGVIAAFGLTVIANALISAQTAIKLVGGLFLLYLGLRTFFSPALTNANAAPTDDRSRGGLFGAYASAFALTLTNPITILVFAGIFAGAGLSAVSEAGGDALCALALVIGVFSGSTLWWLLLSSATGLLRTRFTPRVLVWINRLSGAVILAFALAALIGLLQG